MGTRDRGHVILFSATLLLSAGLLFSVQPMIAKALLPLLGGAPAVWTTCMLFFQAALLAGYVYVDVGQRWLGFRGQALLHLALLIGVALRLPIPAAPEWDPPQEELPVVWLLVTLATSAGLPFLALSANAPLLQSWFARTRHEAAGDPYFLYAASNLGSLAALLAYPLAVEPALTLPEQTQWWTTGYVLLVVLTAGCMTTAWATAAHSEVARRDSPRDGRKGFAPLTTGIQPGALILLAFAPSSLLLGVTNYLTTDLAAVPLLWVIPLAIYLLTFVLTFARRPPIPAKWMARLLPIVTVGVVFAMLGQATEPLSLLVAAHLLLLFVAGMVCHGELARRRPALDSLTGYYLCIALGGVLGGVFNGLIAPAVFWGIAEYPLAVVLTCLLIPPQGSNGQPAWKLNDLGWPLALGMLTAGLILAVQVLGWAKEPRGLAVMFGLPAVLCFTLASRPLRFGLGVGAMLLAGTLHEGIHGRTIFQERSFFGVHRVTINANGTAHLLVHGNTVHGMQWLDPDKRREALTYYHANGPIGLVFAHLQERRNDRPVGLVGLGAGTLASYGQPKQEFVFFEIDPEVVRIAENPRYFTYLRDSKAVVGVVGGDARLTLAGMPANHFGLIVIDAFSSDAIPMHLLTRESLALCRNKLAPGGILAFHVSNRYLDLAPVLGDLAGDAGMVCLSRDDNSPRPAGADDGKRPSQWVLMAARKQDLPASALWLPVPPRPGVPVWTDAYSNLAGALRWGSP